MCLFTEKRLRNITQQIMIKAKLEHRHFFAEKIRNKKRSNLSEDEDNEVENEDEVEKEKEEPMDDGDGEQQEEEEHVSVDPDDVTKNS
jgi:hypothetical protein